MTRSSRHKSHKQSKHSSREDRDYSDSEGDVRMKERNGKVEAAARVSRDSEKVSKSKGSADSKSKPSRRKDGGSEKVEIVSEKEGMKGSSKRKLEKDSGCKEVQEHKESKGKEHGSEKDRRLQDVKGGDGEAKRRQGSQLVDFGEERQLKRVKSAGTRLQEELRNTELEKDFEKQIRTDTSSEKDKNLDDARKSDEKRLLSRDDHAKNVKYRDERQKDGSDRYKYREDIGRDHRHRDGKQREDVNRDKRHRDDKSRDDRALRDHSSDKYDSKHMRDENILNASESRQKKLRSQNSNRDGSPVYEDRRSRYKDDGSPVYEDRRSRYKDDGSPVYEDRRSRYKDDKEKRRFDDREDRSDLKSHSIKDQHSDFAKKSSTGKLELDADRDRSCSRHIDLGSGLGHSRRRSPPVSSSHVLNDQHRQSKQAEAKYRHSGSEERAWSNAVSTRELAAVAGALGNDSACQSMDKSRQKDDNYLGESSAERCQNSGARASPMQRVERSPSSSIERRYVNKANVGRSIDNEDSGDRSGGFKDARNYSGNEGKGGRDLFLLTHSGDEHSQVGGDNFPESSPFGRNYLPTNSKYFLPPPPSRAGVDNPSILGSLEDENGGRSNSRDKRIGDSNTGRTWNGAPNWPSPVANGFIPFQHAQPPLGFHPMMQQFPAPSMLGIQHSRELNHTRVPYHIPDSDRFSGHARPFGHAWDANNGVIGNDTHMYARLDWDHNRTMISSRGWEKSVDMWKHNGGVALEFPSVSQKEYQSVPAAADVVWPVQSDQVAHSERNESDLLAESIETDQSTDVAKGISEVAEDISEKTHLIPKISKDADVRLLHFYLAKLDISADLTRSELYNQCISLVEPEQDRTVDEHASWPLFIEVEKGVRVKISSNPRSGFLFGKGNDSVFQRAVSLYEKQKEETRAIYPSLMKVEEVSSHGAMSSEEEKLVLSSTKQEKPAEAVPTCDMEVVEDPVRGPEQVKVEMPEPLDELEVRLAILEKSEPDPVTIPVEPNTPVEVKMEVEPVLRQVTSADAVEDQISTRGNQSPCVTEEHKKLVDTMCGSLVFSNVSSSEACEGEMPEAIDSGLVNLSRIHQSQSTH